VWLFHHSALRRGGRSLGAWWILCWQEFHRAFQPGAEPNLALERPRPAAAVPAIIKASLDGPEGSGLIGWMKATGPCHSEAATRAPPRGQRPPVESRSRSARFSP
jgi:hypothetical protein